MMLRHGKLLRWRKLKVKERVRRVRFLQYRGGLEAIICSGMPVGTQIAIYPFLPRSGERVLFVEGNWLYTFLRNGGFCQTSRNFMRYTHYSGTANIMFLCFCFSMSACSKCGTHSTSFYSSDQVVKFKRVQKIFLKNRVLSL